MIRFVRSPDGDVLADVRGKLPGRGAYCCWNHDCLKQAVARQQFGRAFKQSCRSLSAGELVDQIKAGLLQHMENLIGMARKSTQVISGSRAVIDALDQPERLALVLVAADSTSGHSGKIRNKAASSNVECVEVFNKTELGRIFGRSEHSVLGLHVGPLAAAFQADLYKYRDMSGEN